MFDYNDNLKQKVKNIKLVLTDNDGVLTDGGVYYSANGESFKKFNIRDGMGVARLREIGLDVGIISGEDSLPVLQRAKKLKISELHLGISDKKMVLDNILIKHDLKKENIAYIGDDCNDLEIMTHCGLTACPADALFFVKDKVDYVCKVPGGHGAFREFAELIIYLKNKN